jgi:hypothetical protein
MISIPVGLRFEAHPQSSCSKYAYLEVDYHYFVAELPRTVPQRWINGLCFFPNTDANEVIVPWPKSIGG